MMRHLSISVDHTVSESAFPLLMDWLWWCTALATTVAIFSPISLPCVVLHESCGVCTQMNIGEKLLQILIATIRISNTTVFRKDTGSLVTWGKKYIQADGGHFEQLAWAMYYTINSYSQ